MASDYQLFDFSYEGKFDLNGNLKEVYNEDALENALRMWFCSMAGEVVRQPTLGGFIYDMLYKPMTTEDLPYHIMGIRNGFHSNFMPYAQIQGLNVEPDFEKRAWIVDLDLFVPEFNYKLVFSVALKNQVA